MFQVITWQFFYIISEWKTLENPANLLDNFRDLWKYSWCENRVFLNTCLCCVDGCIVCCICSSTWETLRRCTTYNIHEAWVRCVWESNTCGGVQAAGRVPAVAGGAWLPHPCPRRAAESRQMEPCRLTAPPPPAADNQGQPGWGKSYAMGQDKAPSS